MPINTNVTKDQITVAVGETQIDVNVSGGVGPTGNSGTIAVSAPITNAGTSTAAVIGLSTGTGLALSAGSLTVSYGTTAGTACQGNDARLSDSREWSAATVSQADAEAGTSTSRFAFTPRRIFEAIAAWWAGSASKAKLDGIAAGATANATDAQLRDRATHTGTQLASTISDFTTAVVAAAPPTTNASLLTSGTLPDARLSGNIARTSDVSSAVASLVNSAPAALDTLNELAAALGNDASFSTTVTNALAAKAPINSPTFTGTVGGITKSMVGLGNVDNTSDANKPVSTAQAAADSAVASAAAADATSKANAAQAAAVQRANHTGTQAIGTVDGLQAALDAKASLSHAHSASDVTSGTLDFARLPYTVVYPVRAVHVGGVLQFNGQFLTTPSLYLGGTNYGDLLTLATIQFPATTVAVDVSQSVSQYIAANPGRTLTYASLEVALVDAANRIVGWGATATDASLNAPNGTGGTTMAVSLFAFPALGSNWVLGSSTYPSLNAGELTPFTAYKLCQSRYLDVDRTDWGNIPNKPNFAAVATSGSAADITSGTLSASLLPSTTVTAGSYGSASSVATYTVDAAGRLTAAGSTAIAISAGAVSGLASIATSGSASDLGTGTVAFARLPVGQTSTTVAAGNDARFTDQRVPTDGSVTAAKITSGGLSATAINWAAIQPWAANTAYAKGDLVSYLGVAYRRSAAGTTGAAFSSANWQQITPSEFLASQITSGTVAVARLPTVLEQTVTVGNSGTSTTLSLTNGSVQTVTLNGNCTFTMPTASAGASLTLFLTQSGTFTATFTGVLWSGGTAPTITATNGKVDILVFVSNGTSWYGTALQNF